LAEKSSNFYDFFSKICQENEVKLANFNYKNRHFLAKKSLKKLKKWHIFAPKHSR